MPTNYALIPCEVSPGLFTNEQAVTIRLANGKTITLFADKTLIQDKDSKTYLKVTKIDSGSRSKKSGKVVLLPTEAFESGSRWLHVSGNNQLAMA